jgi:copper oxidase (laccase) domain-containing protein
MNWLTPDWPAPASVKACVTTREGGVSEAPFDSLNLGDHVDDRPEAVAENRRRLTDHFSDTRLPGCSKCTALSWRMRRSGR